MSAPVPEVEDLDFLQFSVWKREIFELIDDHGKYCDICDGGWCETSVSMRWAPNMNPDDE